MGRRDFVYCTLIEYRDGFNSKIAAKDFLFEELRLWNSLFKVFLRFLIVGGGLLVADISILRNKHGWN